MLHSKTLVVSGLLAWVKCWTDKQKKYLTIRRFRNIVLMMLGGGRPGSSNGSLWSGGCQINGRSTDNGFWRSSCPQNTIFPLWLLRPTSKSTKQPGHQSTRTSVATNCYWKIINNSRKYPHEVQIASICHWKKVHHGWHLWWMHSWVWSNEEIWPDCGSQEWTICIFNSRLER